MRPTDEQQAIIDSVQGGEHVVIEAGAGTGKSTTLRLIGESNPERGGIYLAFNRSVADEARMRFPGTVACQTAHALARRSVIQSDPWIADRLNEGSARLLELFRDKDNMNFSKALADHLGIRSWFRVMGRGRKDISSWKIGSLARETVRRFCYSDERYVKAEHVPYVQGVPNMDELRSTVLPYARQVWEDLQRSDGVLPFEHDHYMKMWALSNPKIYADYVMVDEAQDTNPCLASVIKDQEDIQVVLVGDSRQQLFEWRGARDIMTGFEGERLFLTQSFRFGDAVAEEANRWLDYLDAPLRLRGMSSIDSTIEPIENPRAVLCRTNADVVDQALRAQESGVPVTVVGGTNEIIDFAKAAAQLQRDGKTSHPELAIFKSWSDVLEYVREESPGGSFGTMMRLIERYGVEKVIGIAERCVPESQAERVVSTVHKVKGLEWDTVAVDGGVAPDPEDGDDVSPASLMIPYVAVTRAKLELDTSAISYYHRRRELIDSIEQRKAKVGGMITPPMW